MSEDPAEEHAAPGQAPAPEVPAPPEAIEPWAPLALPEPAREMTLEQMQYADALARSVIAKREALREDFARSASLPPAELERWERLPGFWDTVHEWALFYLGQDVPDWLRALSSNAKQGDLPSAKFLLGQLGKLKNMATAVEETTVEDFAGRKRTVRRSRSLSDDELDKLLEKGRARLARRGEKGEDPQAGGG